MSDVKITSSNAKKGDARVLTPEEFERELPAIDAVAASTEAAIRGWASIAANVVQAYHHATWRYRLTDLRAKVVESGRLCPYSITYLLQLAEAHEAVGGNFDRGVTISVLIEGRKLPNLLTLVESGAVTTVPQMKAIVTKEANPDDSRSVEEIVAEKQKEKEAQSTARKTEKELKAIERSATERSDELIADIQSRCHTYCNAIQYALNDGVEFDTVKLSNAIVAVRSLSETLNRVIADNAVEIAA